MKAEPSIRTTAVAIGVNDPVRYALASHALTLLAALESGMLETKNEPIVVSRLEEVHKDMLDPDRHARAARRKLLDDVRPYLAALITQCEFAMFSFSQIGVHLKAMSDREHQKVCKDSHDIPFWASAHAAFVFCANVSKLLWPVEKACRERRESGEGLRKILNVGDSLVIRDRALRDNLEHFDEKLTEWIATSVGRCSADMIIIQKGRIKIGNNDPGDFFRSFDPDQAVFGFRGHEVDGKKLIEEVRHLHRVAKAVQQEALTPHKVD